MAEKFDAIVVGCGPAGSATAYRMAKAGLKVIMIERGEYPGAKNVMGGVLYRHPLDEILPEFIDEAPIERPLVEQNYWILGADSNVKIGYRDLKWGNLHTTTLLYFVLNSTNGLPRRRLNRARY